MLASTVSRLRKRLLMSQAVQDSGSDVSDPEWTTPSVRKGKF